jgi:hypothetical protein
LANYKRILKTGALAVAVTIAFAIFAYRVAEWSRGLPAQTAGQGQGSPTANVCSPGTGAPTIRVVPQVAIGSFDGGLTKYSTYVQIVNISGAAQNVTASFYKEDGNPMDNVTLTAGPETITNGVLPATSILKDGVLVVGGGDKNSRGTLGWGRITACGAVSISSFFELRDGANHTLLSRASVAATAANMSSFVIPRIREVPTGLDVALALVNTASSGTATLKAELKDGSGSILAMKNIQMPAGSHQQFFTKDLFAPLTEPAGRSYQYVKFSSTSPSFAAIALAIEGATLTSFPVDMLE